MRDVAPLAATIALSDETLEEIARRVTVLQQRGDTGSPWLTADEAAERLRCPISRIRKLTSTGDLPVHRDGRRVLYHRDELDEFIRHGGGVSP
jgi:excisionase family DNA binding protein